VTVYFSNCGTHKLNCGTHKLNAAPAHGFRSGPIGNDAFVDAAKSRMVSPSGMDLIADEMPRGASAASAVEN
jgi:hypothetical protein